MSTRRAGHESRREFLRSSAMMAAAGVVASNDAAVSVLCKDPGVPPSGIRSMRLTCATEVLDDMRAFYTATLGLVEVECNAKPDFAVRLGGVDTPVAENVARCASMTFKGVEADPDKGPYHHFAFNIPENQLGEAKAWLADRRIPLLRNPAGGDEYHFRAWNAHAVYFNDPAGNIVEFIARHNLKNASDAAFGSTSILSISEIAVVVDDVDVVVRGAAAFGLMPFANSISNEFAALGGDEQLLIVVRRGRVWNSGHGRAAEVFPISASLLGTHIGSLKSDDFGYEVTFEN